MAKQVKLSAQARPGVGRAAVRKIKQAGLVPAVVYGAKQAPQHLQLSARDVKNVLARATGEHFLVELEIADGGAAPVNRLALVQEVQHHPLRGDVLHVDFHAVSEDEELHATVPIETTGEAPGVKTGGGLMEVSLHEVPVACLPRDLPEVIIVDVSALNIGDAIHARDLQLPAGVTLHGVDDELTVVRVTAPSVATEETTTAEAPSQPEVIKEKKPEDGKEAK